MVGPRETLHPLEAAGDAGLSFRLRLGDEPDERVGDGFYALRVERYRGVACDLPREPLFEQAQGTPRAIASIKERPKPSKRLGKT